MKPLYDKCIAWINSITPEGVTVYVRNQNAPAPPSPRITVRIAATSDIATYRGGVAEGGDQQVVHWRRFTLAMQIYGTEILEAENLAAQIMDLVRFSELRTESLGRNVTFNNVLSGPDSVDEIIGTEFEPRVILDFNMSATRDLVYDVGTIENVQFVGDVSDLTTGRDVSAEETLP